MQNALAPGAAVPLFIAAAALSSQHHGHGPWLCTFGLARPGRGSRTEHGRARAAFRTRTLPTTVTPRALRLRYCRYPPRCHSFTLASPGVRLRRLAACGQSAHASPPPRLPEGRARQLCFVLCALCCQCANVSAVPVLQRGKHMSSSALLMADSQYGILALPPCMLERCTSEAGEGPSWHTTDCLRVIADPKSVPDDGRRRAFVLTYRHRRTSTAVVDVSYSSLIALPAVAAAISIALPLLTCAAALPKSSRSNAILVVHCRASPL